MTAKTPKTFTLITGASGGLGAEFARVCASEGRNLILVGRNTQHLRELAHDIDQDITVHLVTQDLLVPGAAEKIYRRVRRLRVEVDQLINNAGLGDFNEFIRSKAAVQEQIIAVNITATVLLTRLFLPRMLNLERGRILNMGSILSFAPLPLMSVYAASKSFVLAFSEALTEELRDTNITVTCLCPGPFKTRFDRNAHLPATHPIARTTLRAESVARFGYQAMQAGTPVAVYGLRNKLLAHVAYKYLPRSLVRRMMSRYHNL